MSQPFLGEIRMWAISFAPLGWAYCDGQPMPIMQNQALFSLVGTQFGGDGRTSFNLPDFRGRAPVGPSIIPTFYSPAIPQTGNTGGFEDVSITTATMATHHHIAYASTEDADKSGPGPDLNRILGDSVSGGSLFTPNGSPFGLVPMASESISPAGGGGIPHENMQPFQVVGFCIATAGLYPPRN